MHEAIPIEIDSENTYPIQHLSAMPQAYAYGPPTLMTKVGIGNRFMGQFVKLGHEVTTIKKYNCYMHK